MVGRNSDFAVGREIARTLAPMDSHQLSVNLEQLDLNQVGLVVQATEAVEDVVISA